MEQFWLAWKAALSLYIATLLWFKTNVQNEQEVDVIMHMLFSNTISLCLSQPTEFRIWSILKMLKVEIAYIKDDFFIFFKENLQMSRTYLSLHPFLGRSKQQHKEESENEKI